MTSTACTGPRRRRPAAPGTTPPPRATWRLRPPSSTVSPAPSTSSRRRPMQLDCWTEARQLADGSTDPAVRAALALAECGVLADAFGSDLGHARTTVAETLSLAERAVELAEQTGEPLAESAALDALTGAQCWAGQIFEPAATTRRRADLITALPVTPASAHELVDVLAMASETCLGIGDLPGARHWGVRLRDLPLLAERGHVATSRLLVADALAGHDDDVVTAGRRFARVVGTGRPPQRARTGHGRRRREHDPPVSVAMTPNRPEWLAVETELGSTRRSPRRVRPRAATASSCFTRTAPTRPCSCWCTSPTGWARGSPGSGVIGTPRCARRPPSWPGTPMPAAASRRPAPTYAEIPLPPRSSIGPRPPRPRPTARTDSRRDLRPPREHLPSGPDQGPR